MIRNLDDNLGPWILRKVPPSISISRLRRFALRHPRHALCRHPQAAAAGAGAAGELAAGDEAIVVPVQGAEVGGTWWNTNRCWELTDTFNKKQGKDRNDMCSLIFGDVMWGTSAKYQQIGQKND